MPSIRLVGMNSSSRDAAALSGSIRSTVIVPRSTSLRSAGQGLVASLVGSVGSASWADRRNWAGPLPSADRQLVHQEVWRLPGGIRGGQMLRAVDGRDLEAERLALAGRVDEHEGIDAVIGLAGEAGRGGDAAARRRDGRVARDEALECGGLGGVRATGGHRLQQRQEVLGRGDREKGQRVGDDVHLRAVGQLEAHRHAVRAGVRVAVGDRGYAGRIGEAHGDRDRSASEQGSGAQLRAGGAGLEAALGDDALGVVGTQVGLLAEQLVERVDDLRRHVGVVGEAGHREGTGEDRRQGGRPQEPDRAHGLPRMCLMAI